MTTASRLTKLLLSIILLVLLLSSIVVLVLVFIFSRHTNRSPLYFINILKNSITNNQFVNQPSQNIIILGLDPRNDQLERTNTTDTIIYSHFNTQFPSLNLVSIPRDLWVYSLQAKVNEIYPRALSIGNTSLILSQFSELTGQNISHYLIITTQDLIDFVNLIGGVDVYLDNGFIDNQYPNPDHINNPQSKAPIFITIEFKKGQNHLDHTSVTQFVRSRKSSDDPFRGGTDLGRITRQQLLIDAIFKKILQPKYLTDLNFMAKSYNFWHNHFQTNLNDQYLSDLIFIYNRKMAQIKVNKHEIPIAPNSEAIGVIYHPNTLINSQWVFIPKTIDYRELINYLQNITK